LPWIALPFVWATDFIRATHFGAARSRPGSAFRAPSFCMIPWPGCGRRSDRSGRPQAGPKPTPSRPDDERGSIRDDTKASKPIPDFAEFVIGPATSGRTRWLSSGRRTASPTKRKKGRRNAGKRVPKPPRLSGAAHAAQARVRKLCAHEIRRGALACRRSTCGSCRWAFRPAGAASGQASWDAAERSVAKLRPTGGERPCAVARALPAPACPSPGKAPPGPVVVPVSMMPEAARERRVSRRARAPHSLRSREYLRDGVP